METIVKLKNNILNPIEDYYRMVTISSNAIYGSARKNTGNAYSGGGCWSVQPELKDELYQSGMVALVEAYSKFNPDKNASFATYAFYRIRGAMYDYLRNEDTVPRAVRANLKIIRKNIDNNTNNETPLTDREIQSAHKNNVVVIQADYDTTSIANIPHLSSEYHNIEYSETVLKLLKSVKLTPSERLVIDHYYFKEHNYAFIGKELNITESRVSQLHKSAITRLNKYATRTKLIRVDRGIRA